MKSDTGFETFVATLTLLQDEKIGIASGDLSDALPFFERRRLLPGGLCNIDEGSGPLRMDPGLILSNYKSALVLFKKYPVYPLAEQDDIGQIASLAVGEDYHRVHRQRLTQLAGLLQEAISDFEYMICVDTAPLLDRQMAYQTGMVFYGKHQQVILPEWGAGFSIGYLLTNQEVKGQVPRMVSRCGSCDACLKACPTQALSSDGFEARKCISWITQKKGDLSDFEVSSFKSYIYGCDACLLACPYTQIEKEINSRALLHVTAIADKSNSEIKALFRDSAILWKGASLIRRNATLLKNNKTNHAEKDF